jgi:hypothetical protein
MHQTRTPFGRSPIVYFIELQPNTEITTVRLITIFRNELSFLLIFSVDFVSELLELDILLLL